MAYDGLEKCKESRRAIKEVKTMGKGLKKERMRNEGRKRL